MKARPKVVRLEAFRPPVHDPVTSDDLKSLVGAGVSMALALVGFSLNIGGLIFVSLVVALWALKKSWGNR